MLKKLIKPFFYVSSLAFFLSFVVSCEDDFTDIGTTIVSNNQFTTNDTIFEVFVTGKDIERVQADGIQLGGTLGQYLLGVYNNGNYEKIEASIISQLTLPLNLSLVDQEYDPDTTVVTTIDTVFLRIPYQATRTGTDAIGPVFQLDSIIGDQEQPFTLNVFQLSSFLNILDPDDPARTNTYFSDEDYEVFSEKLNVFEDTQFTPRARDTAQFVLRRLSNGDIYDTDTVQYNAANPYISIPLKKDVIKQLFLDQYGSAELSSQDAFNNYFRGIKIQAEGNSGSLMSLDFDNASLPPMVDIYYTNTVLRNGGTIVVDTISKNDQFNLSGIRNSEYKMTPSLPPTFNKVAVQGTAGSMAQVNILGFGQLEYLRLQDWLINDATLTLYVDKTTVGSDTIATPFRLYIYKDGTDGNGEPLPTQILDALTEGTDALDGNLNLDGDRNPDNYTFKITDYISELASGELNDLQPLGIRVFNPTDLPLTDTIVDTYNWNPKAVMLLNHEAINGARRATLKISYSVKTQQND
jgi:hypothetical protein